MDNVFSDMPNLVRIDKNKPRPCDRFETTTFNLNPDELAKLIKGDVVNGYSVKDAASVSTYNSDGTYSVLRGSAPAAFFNKQNVALQPHHDDKVDGTCESEGEDKVEGKVESNVRGKVESNVQGKGTFLIPDKDKKRILFLEGSNSKLKSFLKKQSLVVTAQRMEMQTLQRRVNTSATKYAQDRQRLLHEISCKNAALEQQKSIQPVLDMNKDLSGFTMTQLEVLSARAHAEITRRRVNMAVQQERAIQLEMQVESYLCQICYGQPANCTLGPCGHSKICKECAHKVTICPFCNQEINMKIKMY
jgi:hypothetical protein